MLGPKGEKGEKGEGPFVPKGPKGIDISLAVYRNTGYKLKFVLILIDIILLLISNNRN